MGWRGGIKRRGIIIIIIDEENQIVEGLQNSERIFF
jgi:hypothetical protein